MAGTPDFQIVPEDSTFTIFAYGRREMEGIPCRGSAEMHAADLVQDAADRDAAEAAAIEADAYEDALDRIYAWVNAQGGYVAPGDHAAAGQSRAVNDALAALDALGMALPGERRAA